MIDADPRLTHMGTLTDTRSLSMLTGTTPACIRLTEEEAAWAGEELGPDVRQALQEFAHQALYS